MMEVTSYGELERQTPEGDTGHPLGDLCAKLRHWPKQGSQGEQVKPTWFHSGSQNIATTMCFGEWLDCGLCVVQHHVRQRSVREKPSPSWLQLQGRLGSTDGTIGVRGEDQPVGLEQRRLIIN